MSHYRLPLQATIKKFAKHLFHLFPFATTCFSDTCMRSRWKQMEQMCFAKRIEELLTQSQVILRQVIE